jgi:DNA-3-methyladenine glycosylase I
MNRCSFCQGNPLYEAYHDLEWGSPQTNDQKLFESLVLETFQAGLNWLTILRKREAFRAAFDQFDVEKVAAYDDEKISSLLNDTGIIRNRSKINATITNAKAFQNIQRTHESFARYLWSFTDGRIIHNRPRTLDELPSQTALSEKLSKDLKKQGFSFTGPVVIYAFLQANGVVNDHAVDCHSYAVRSKVETVVI